MDATIDVFPEENKTKTVTSTCLRRECDVCGAPAHFKHTFLLDGARSNRASSAYGRDDCSYCEDACRYVCKEHISDREAPPGMSWCSTFPASDRFKHMFLYWAEVKS